MYELEIKTRSTLKKIKNPQKAQVLNSTLCDFIRVMDNNGKWHVIAQGFGLPIYTERIIVARINTAIKKQQPSVYVDI